MASLRIRSIAVIIVAALALSGVVFVGNSMVIRANISNADQFWRSFQDDSSPKARALEFLVANMGFGGMIHQFKNYVLRRDKQRVEKIINMADGALAALKQYEAVGVNEAEIRAIKDIRGVINLYTGSIAKIQRLAERGLDARGIDAVIRISDGPALTGIGALMRAVADDRQVLRGQISKTELLSRINAAMGYGGMIHQFKNYVLRQDRPRIEKIHKAVTAALKDIAMYRSLGTSPGEAEALKAIEDVVLTYNSNIDKAMELAGLGETPEAIDRQIKVNNKPALNGMSRLVTEIAAQNQKVRRNLDRSFAEIQLLAAIIMAVAVISMVALIILSVWALNFRIVRPIREITDTMDDLANGKTEFELRQQENDNEIGQMAKAVIVFRDNAIEMKRMEEERLKAERRVEEEKHALMNKMADEFQASIGGVVETVSSAATELQSSAQSMSEISERTSTQADAVTAASEEASANVQTVASAAEELSSSIAEISRQVAQSTEISGSAVKAAGKANEMVQHLAMSAHKIGEVVEMIADIADQTNLLALNATIEAARAGEAGKGFAVVASEVKNLASQTARATDAIGSQIDDIQGATKNSVRAIQEITNTIGEINEIASTIAAAVEQQGAATREIARNVEQAASGTDEMSSNIKGVTQTAGVAGSSAAHVLGAANELSEQSEILKTEVDKFMNQVRAA